MSNIYNSTAMKCGSIFYISVKETKLREEKKIYVMAIFFPGNLVLTGRPTVTRWAEKKNIKLDH